MFRHLSYDILAETAQSAQRIVLWPYRAMFFRLCALCARLCENPVYACPNKVKFSREPVDDRSLATYV